MSLLPPEKDRDCFVCADRHEADRLREENKRISAQVHELNVRLERVERHLEKVLRVSEIWVPDKTRDHNILCKAKAMLEKYKHLEATHDSNKT